MSPQPPYDANTFPFRRSGFPSTRFTDQRTIWLGDPTYHWFIHKDFEQSDQRRIRLLALRSTQTNLRRTTEWPIDSCGAKNVDDLTRETKWRRLADATML